MEPTDERPLSTPVTETLSPVEKNRQTTKQFLENSLQYAKITEGEPKKEFEKVVDIFSRLHELVNNPETRETAALKKAELIRDIALEQFPGETLETLKNRGINIEIISAVDPLTNTLTHNTIVTFGHPETGPNTVLAVHHDTIKAKDNDYQLKTQIQDSGEPVLIGRTIQDDTIHVAATLAILSKIKVPEKGSVTIVFSDHEENGCRGTSSLLDRIIAQLSKNHAAAFFALESTDRKLAIGHKGKFSGEIKETISQTSPAENLLAFIRHLRHVQENAREQSGESALGQTIGTSTTGTFAGESLNAVVDIRTNDICTPDKVESIWSTPLSGIEEEKLITQAQKRIAANQYTITTTSTGGIRLESNTAISHPAEFNVYDDDTILPLLYLITKVLQKQGKTANIRQIEYGDPQRPNSIPSTATIEGDLGDINLSELTQQMIAFQPETIITEPDIFKTVSKINKSDCVISPNDEVVAKIVSQTQTETTTMNFMTDIGRIFNEAKKQLSNVYGFVFGVGNPKKLHSVEELTTSDFQYLPNAILQLLNITHQNIS